MQQAARELAAMGPDWVLVKGALADVLLLSLAGRILAHTGHSSLNDVVCITLGGHLAESLGLRSTSGTLTMEVLGRFACMLQAVDGVLRRR